jgi:hypothetical protein
MPNQYKFTRYTHDQAALRRASTKETTYIFADTAGQAWAQFDEAQFDEENEPDRIESTEILCEVQS